MNRTERGFTLIEIMMVMAILSLLIVALLPALNIAGEEAARVTDKLNLQRQFVFLQAYKNKHGHFPPESGHKFVLAPWVDGVVPRTRENRDRYFSPTQSEDPHWIELKQRPLEEIWQSLDEVSSLDTSYAGRLKTRSRDRRKAEQVLMASDNEFGAHYADGTVLVLMSSGAVHRLEPTDALLAQVDK